MSDLHGISEHGISEHEISERHDFEAENLTPAFLKGLGRNEVAYLRTYEVKGRTAVVLHAADGIALAVQNDLVSARNAAREQALEIVSLH